MSLETKQVVDRHLAALMERDLVKLVDHYAEDAFFLSNLTPGPVRGQDALRQLWTQILTILTPEVLATLTLLQQQVEGDVAYLKWSASPVIPFGVDTLVVRNGKIVAHTTGVEIAGSE
ncbi:MAG TPA: nuclear transport factor 2 family protein [Anaerolineae bacterium]|nr:nuclear transport factor 2 family protein [Anaerolineae bacterium]